MSASQTPLWPSAVDRLAAASSEVGRPWLGIRRSAAFLAFLCVVLTATADVLFYQRPLGFTAAIFTILLALVITARSARYLALAPGRLVAIGLIGICLCLVEHPTPLRIIMAALGVMSIALLNTRGWTASVPAWAARWFELAARSTFQLPVDVAKARLWRRAHGGRRSPWHQALSGWTIPLLLSVVFIAMFTLANPIISKWMQEAGRGVQRVIVDFSDYISFLRIALWLTVAFIAWSLLRGRTRLDRPGLDAAIFAPPALAPGSADQLPAAGLIARCLVLFNVVFAVQMALDLVTVLSNGANLPDGMTYAAYARRGAYPLVATALLAAAFVLVAFPTGLGPAATERMKWPRRLVYLWIGQNIILTLSAGWRLWMYVEAFGLTRLRIAAAIWMSLVALGLSFIIWRIVRHRTNAWLLRVNFTSLLAALYLCCWFNWDRMIAAHDVENCHELGGSGPLIDLAYMRSLGPESIPTLEWLAAQLDADHPAGRQAAIHAGHLRQDLDNDLRSWHGWTLRRHRLATD